MLPSSMIGLLFTTAALASSGFDIAWNSPWPSYCHAGIKRAGADGIIVWGAGKDASTNARCANMAKYLETTLGPKLLLVGK